MYPASSEFKRLVRHNHRVITRAEVWQGENVLLELEPLSGKIEDDLRRTVRRTCSVTLFSRTPEVTSTPIYGTYTDLAGLAASYSALATKFANYGTMRTIVDTEVATVDDGVVPDSAFDPVTPFGNELRLWRGLEITTDYGQTYSELASAYATYTALAAANVNYGQISQISTTVREEELIPLGVYLMTNVEISQSTGGVQISITGQDRSLRISRNRWTTPYTITAGTNLATALEKLLESRWGEVQTAFSATDETVGRIVLGPESENDPWKDAQKIARSHGMDLYFDSNGVCRLEAVRVYEDTTSPDEIYLENEEAMVLGVRRALTTEQTYNGVIVTGESSDTDSIARAEAWDEDPESPTYRYGPFGEVPRFYSSPTITTNASAAKAAAAVLAKSKGIQEGISWTQLTDPSLEAGDSVGIINEATKTNRILVVDRLSIPLRSSEAMEATARTIRSSLDEEAA